MSKKKKNKQKQDKIIAQNPLAMTADARLTTASTSTSLKSTGRFSFLTRNIILLSFISLFTDISSEMLYPVMPLYLTQIGYGVLAVGLIEGLAEAFSGLSKGFFGYISDRVKDKAIFVKFGYGISAFSKPLMGLTGTLPIIFLARLADRFGKGIRTAPRDAILAVESNPTNRGTVFGFHRSMDTTGAMIGPVISLIFLYFFPSQYKSLFLIVLIPGMIAFALTQLVKTDPKKFVDKTQEKPVKTEKKESLWAGYKRFWKTANPNYKLLMFGLLLLSLVNSSDMFLLLRANELGLTGERVILAFIIYNVVFALSALPLGMLSDKLGYKLTFMIGMVAFAVVYTGFAMARSSWLLFGLFATYGIFAAVNEAVTKAWLSCQLGPDEQATGMGLFLSLQAIFFLTASVVTGLVWETFGGDVAFSLVAMAAAGIILFFSFIKVPETGGESEVGRIGCNSSH